MREGVGDRPAPPFGGAAEPSGAGLVEIDGASGEGGGQILRTSLALSMITGRPLHMRRIRAGREKPGLRRQHVACVQAAARLCDAEVRGAEVSSSELTFRPGYRAVDVAGPREVAIDIGTQGAALLVVQTVIVPAIVARQPLKLIVRGGTHNPFAPPFDFIERVFVPHLRAMGADVTVSLARHGFATGDHRHETGELTLDVGVGELRPIEILEAGAVTARRAIAVSMGLPTHVAERELGVVRDELGFGAAECEVRTLTGKAAANLLMIEIQRAGGGELVTVHGERGLPAETVAARACAEVQRYLDAEVPVGEHLADQLLLPLAVAGGGAFRTVPLSLHATTNIETIRAFLELRVTVEGDRVAIHLSARDSDL